MSSNDQDDLSVSSRKSSARRVNSRPSLTCQKDDLSISVKKTKKESAEKKKSDGLIRMINRQMDKKYTTTLFDYRFNDIVKTIAHAKKILRKEKNMLAEVKPPCVVVGDIHGQYGDLLRVFHFFNEDSQPGYTTQKFVFLGDYVDRGKQSLECIMLVLLFKIKYSDSFILLRGNHECRAINRVYGFHAELVERFGEPRGPELWAAFNDLFTHMPLAAILGGSILCMHGGISPSLNSLDDIRNIPKPLDDPLKNQLATDLLWADPMIDLKGFEKNSVRGVSVCFGEDAVHAISKKLNIKMIIRAHQMMMNGFQVFAGRSLLTIFTAAAYYPTKANRGAVVFIDKVGHIGFKVLVPIEDDKRGAKVFRGRFDEDDRGLEGTYLRKTYKNSKSTPRKRPSTRTLPPEGIPQTLH